MIRKLAPLVTYLRYWKYGNQAQKTLSLLTPILMKLFL